MSEELTAEEKERLAYLKCVQGRVPLARITVKADGMESTVTVMLDMHDRGKMFVDLSDPVLQHLIRTRDGRLAEVLERVMAMAERSELEQMEAMYVARHASTSSDTSSE